MKVAVTGLDPESAKGILLNLSLRWPNLEAVCHEQVEAALQAACGGVFDLMLVGNKGALSFSEQVRQVRATGDSVLIAFSVYPADDELVAVLDAGADDYLSLTASGPQIVARVSAALRRARPSQTAQEWLQCGELRVNSQTFEAFLKEEPIHLTPTEFRLLSHLLKGKGRLLTHEALENFIWGSESSLNTGTVRKYVQRLRSKIHSGDNSSVRIVTVPGIGYRLVASA